MGIDGNSQSPLQVARVDDRVDPHFEEGITIDVINRGSAVHCLSTYEGDIVVSGSDGVFDNLFLDEIVDICNRFLQPSRSNKFTPQQPAVLEQIARCIVAECHKKTERGPRGELAQSPIGKGGKIDDTCCVVGEVIEWTTRHAEMWSKVQRERKSSGSAFCGLGGSTASNIFHSIFGGGFLRCNHTGSEYDGSDYE